jgi:predicted dehydrogenase
MAEKRIGFVGVGSMGQAAHLRNFVTLPNCRVTAIAEIRPKLAQAVAQRYGIPRVFDSFESMVAEEELDGIVAIQPFSLHGEMVPRLLEHGIPVLTEKPLASSVEDGRKIAAAAKKTGTPLYLAYHKRSDPATAYALNQIEAWKLSGEVGRMRYVRVTMPPGDWSCEGFSGNLHTDENYDPQWGESTPYIGFVNYYIHQVNLLRFLFGEPYEPIFADPSGVTVTVRSASGICGTMENQPFNTSLDWQESALIAFDRGWIRLELPAPMVIDQPGRVTVYSDPGGGATPMLSSPTLEHWHAMRRQAKHFISALSGGPTPLCGPEDGLADLETAQKVIDLFNASRSEFGGA